MPYIDTTLEEDETVVFRARYHWWWNLRSLGLLNAFSDVLVTDRRILKKTGILNARTESIAYTQIEAKDIEQSFWGRVFGFGDIVVYGSGGKAFVFQHLSDPGAVMRAIGRAAMPYQRSQDGRDAARPFGRHRRSPA